MVSGYDKIGMKGPTPYSSPHYRPITGTIS